MTAFIFDSPLTGNTDMQLPKLSSIPVKTANLMHLAAGQRWSGLIQLQADNEMKVFVVNVNNWCKNSHRVHPHIDYLAQLAQQVIDPAK
jgi:hypothetical protein